MASVTIGITENHGADNTEVLFIGFKGEITELKDKVVVTVYEARANLADHKNPLEDLAGHRLE